MDSFTLEIITPEKQAFSETVNSVYVPTVDGEIGVLANHAPLFTLLSEGEIKINAKDKEYFLAIGGGYMQVGNGYVSILVSRALNAEEINEAEIKKAQEMAKDAIKRKVTGDELRAAQSALRRSFAEMKLLHRRRKRPQNISNN